MGKWNGSIMNDMPNGRGVMDYNLEPGGPITSKTYDGDWGLYEIEDQDKIAKTKTDHGPHGVGTMTTEEKSNNTVVIFKGDWKCGQYDGYGLLSIANSSEKIDYHGDWVKGVKNGPGVFRKGRYSKGLHPDQMNYNPSY